MSNKNNGGPAFPAFEHHAGYGQMMAVGGMTLRDYFAAKAMPLALEDYRLTICASDIDPLPEWDPRFCLSVIALRAYKLADAMLAARNAK
jgi:hypothetical protein